VTPYIFRPPGGNYGATTIASASEAGLRGLMLWKERAARRQVPRRRDRPVRGRGGAAGKSVAVEAPCRAA
jgi:hypothetical protein